MYGRATGRIRWRRWYGWQHDARGPDGDLALAHGASRKRQIRQIGAADQQNHRHGRQQQRSGQPALVWAQKPEQAVEGVHSCTINDYCRAARPQSDTSLLFMSSPRPALILGMPVGFVGAAESKEALIASPLGITYITVRGRRGGSAIAAAAVNALASEEE